MKYIEKGVEPRALTDWKALENENWQPMYEDLRGVEKSAVREALFDEQGGICCYCERRLTDADSHIEHFHPQSDLTVDPLDYGNLLYSCQDQLKKGEPRHCGNRKGEWFDEDLLISPLDPDCENAFAYSGDGGIRPTDDNNSAAKTTIEKLELDIDKLRDRRKRAIEPFLDPSLSDMDFSSFVTGILMRGPNGLYPEFFTTIRYLFVV